MRWPARICRCDLAVDAAAGNGVEFNASRSADRADGSRVQGCAAPPSADSKNGGESGDRRQRQGRDGTWARSEIGFGRQGFRMSDNARESFASWRTLICASTRCRPKQPLAAIAGPSSVSARVPREHANIGHATTGLRWSDLRGHQKYPHARRKSETTGVVNADPLLRRLRRHQHPRFAISKSRFA